MTDIVPVILSGGAGTRLWPLSRESFPKQLLPLYSERTLIQETALRFDAAPIVVCNHDHRFIVADQLREVGVEPRAVVVEPVGRNTAPAAAVAAILLADDPDALMLVMPSDHLIKNVGGLRKAVKDATPLARQGKLLTFGVPPTEPNTGYGYIRRGAALGPGFMVERFVEKPDAATAAQYLESGEYLWNSGIFLFPARLYLEELAGHRPDMVESCRQALATGRKDMFLLRLNADAFGEIKGQSIDYAVMERTAHAAVVPIDISWSDIGSWSALWSESGKDDDGNVAHGDVLSIDSHDCYLRSSGRLVAAVGLDNVVVVATEDVVLVTDKRRDQDVKAVVERLKSVGRPEAVAARRVWRPWGWFEAVDGGERFLVKHIQVNPGAKLSLQKHWHRSEHWIVVQGTALVTCGDKSFVLRENESTFIPAGTQHRLENPGKLHLRMIEVQSGEYIGEDDIVRLSDDYGRTEEPIAP